MKIDSSSFVFFKFYIYQTLLQFPGLTLFVIQKKKKMF